MCSVLLKPIKIMRKEQFMVGIGIDVAKNKSTVAIIGSNNEMVLTPTDFYHKEDKLNELISIINSIPDKYFIVMEHTGHYHYPILKKLEDEHLPVSVMNPYVIKKYGDVQIRKAKTDKKDACLLARFALEKADLLPKYSAIDAKYADLRFLSRQYDQAVAMRTKAKVQLSNLIDEVMPNIGSVFRARQSGHCDVLYDFIGKFENFENIKSVSEKKFTERFMKWAKSKGYRNAIMKAQTIYELSQDSIPTRTANVSTSIAVQQCLQMLRTSEEASNEILAQMQSIAYTLPEYQIVRSMKGVGDILAPRLIAEVGNIQRFTSAKALVAYAGIDAPPYQSGQYEGTQRHISKRGSAVLRKICFEIMMALKISKPSEDNAAYLFMIKKESEGKPKNVAKIAGINKFLHIYYARLSSI